LGFAKANNQAIVSAQGKYILLLNPDTIVHPGAIQKLIEYLQSHQNVAVVGSRLLNADNSIQVSAFRSPTLVREFCRLFYLDRLIPISQYPASFFVL